MHSWSGLKLTWLHPRNLVDMLVTVELKMCIGLGLTNPIIDIFLGEPDTDLKVVTSADVVGLTISQFWRLLKLICRSFLHLL